MLEHEPTWGDEADVPRIARAMAIEKQRGNDPLYLDMSGVPEHMREYFISSKVKWMDYFFQKLGNEAQTDMFDKTPYYALNQMTKMGIRTDRTCRSDVPGLLAGGLAQAGCANHFAGFHIGMSIGTGWIAGRSAVEDLERLRRRQLDASEVRRFTTRFSTIATMRPRRSPTASYGNCKPIMFAYDVAVWKSADRLQGALTRIHGLQRRSRPLSGAARSRVGAAEGDRRDAAGGGDHSRGLALAPNRA